MPPLPSAAITAVPLCAFLAPLLLVLMPPYLVSLYPTLPVSFPLPLFPILGLLPSRVLEHLGVHVARTDLHVPHHLTHLEPRRVE